MSLETQRRAKTQVVPATEAFVKEEGRYVYVLPMPERRKAWGKSELKVIRSIPSLTRTFVRWFTVARRYLTSQMTRK